MEFHKYEYNSYRINYKIRISRILTVKIPWKTKNWTNSLLAALSLLTKVTINSNFRAAGAKVGRRSMCSSSTHANVGGFGIELYHVFCLLPLLWVKHVFRPDIKWFPLEQKKPTWCKMCTAIRPAISSCLFVYSAFDFRKPNIAFFLKGFGTIILSLI